MDLCSTSNLTMETSHFEKSGVICPTLIMQVQAKFDMHGTYVTCISVCKPLSFEHCTKPFVFLILTLHDTSQFDVIMQVHQSKSNHHFLPTYDFLYALIIFFQLHWILPSKSFFMDAIWLHIYQFLWNTFSAWLKHKTFMKLKPNRASLEWNIG